MTRTTNDSTRDIELERVGTGRAHSARRSDHRRGRVVRTATGFVVVVCVALLAMNAWLIRRAYVTESAQITRANTNLVRSVGQQVEGGIALAQHIVSSIVFELERSDITPESLLKLQPVLVTNVAEMPSIKGLFVYDELGRWLVNSEASSDPSRNNSDRNYFIHRRDSQSSGTLIGGPIVSRSSGEWVIPVSRRINDPDGKFAGVVLATLSVTHMRAVLDRFQIGEQGAIALFHTDKLLVRRPFREADMGRPNTGSPLRKLFEEKRAGTVEGISTIDGVNRIISFEHLVNYPLLVTVAVGKDEALQDWRKASIYQTIWVVLLCLVIGTLGNYLIQSMRRRLVAEQRLRSTHEALTEANERLERLAQEDGLTGLANRRHFDVRLTRASELAQEQQTALALIMVDVDEFKKYNDAYGHLEGDACLRRVAKALQSALHRQGDFVARYGGEEMVLLLPETDVEQAAKVAERARQAVVDLHLPHAATARGYVSVSLGVAAWVPAQDRTPEGLLKAADEALYGAKREGRNRVVIATA